jgi:hypothetical protein
MEGREELDDTAVGLEQLYLGLRTSEGIERGLVAPEQAAGWQRAGWAEIGPERIVLTPEGWLRLDALVGSTGLVAS